ncbi:hypothetical protein FQA47_019477 [Oryzias melastigma]|uniref:Uncharacterized protein n=1 Tax=Oryzias melastigma TaxID=30732 RepID=A0A834F7A1_ORYME|nr:hypothetical protein FQA47_019477 [Oryzias melastigma]
MMDQRRSPKLSEASVRTQTRQVLSVFWFALETIMKQKDECRFIQSLQTSSDAALRPRLTGGVSQPPRTDEDRLLSTTLTIKHVRVRVHEHSVLKEGGGLLIRQKRHPLPHHHPPRDPVTGPGLEALRAPPQKQQLRSPVRCSQVQVVFLAPFADLRQQLQQQLRQQLRQQLQQQL